MIENISISGNRACDPFPKTEIFSVVHGVPLHTAFHHHIHRSNLRTEILLNGRKIASHFYIHR
ncbi:MAG: hypothetical protein AB2693_31390, partial [Candidatus Thiodiazotropha sp.]